MKLNFRKFGQGEPVLILHGLFGCSDNWQRLGKQLAENYEVFLIDQRNHGKSPHTEEFSYHELSDDLLEFIHDQQITGCYLIGHSMGGKAVMTFAQQWEELILKMIVVDMGVKAYPPHNELVVEALQTVDFNLHNTRKEVEKVVSSIIPESSVVQFLLKNLYWKEKGKLAWRFNMPVLIEHMPTILYALPPTVSSVECLFLSGGASNYVLPSDHAEIKKIFPNASFETVPNAGHWVHAESPETFFDLVSVYMEA